MSKIFTTEITSDQITSDNPIHQRLYKAYVLAENFIQGDVLEVGCGEGRGIDRLLPKASTFTAVDKIESALVKLRQKYPTAAFISSNIPPLSSLADNAYDAIVSFQVIEHIEDDKLFLKELHRVAKPGGVVLITTPNKKMSLTRNPWHVREYLAAELQSLGKKFFSSVEMRGITGNEKVMGYYEQNKKSVQRLTRFDILNLQYLLPAGLLKIPYEVMNRLNRNKLQSGDSELVRSIHHDDYIEMASGEEALDLFMICRK
jgi:2-polyprenyl-3-methyl-5-hydroxy-6-metoxy-1,4-benzoquinol methylase